MTSVILRPSDNLGVNDSILQAIGHMPLVHLQQLGMDLACPTYAKFEFFNPVGSVKDRIAVSPGSVRLSGGFENVDDLLNNLSEAFGKKRTT